MYKCKEPKFSNLEETMIDVIWEHPDYGDIPFTAYKDDTEAYGREIYQLALAGEYGTIAPYDGLSEEELLAQVIRFERDWLLQELDVFVSSPLRWSSLTPEQQQALGVYRQALLNVPQQEGFPHEVVWPNKPEVLTQ